jgi:dihydroneopterin aldolase
MAVGGVEGVAVDSNIFTIHIEELRVETIIGILDFERTSKQQVVVETKINYNYTGGEFLDYVQIVERIEKLLQREEYMLLEEALEGIGNSLMGDYPQIVTLSLKISKPNIMPNCTVSLLKKWE